MMGGLTPSGAVAAGVSGALALAAGWSWAVLLVAFYVTATGLSRYRKAFKEVRTAAIVSKVGPRDAIQVFANGGIFVGAAAGSIVAPGPFWMMFGIGAIAAATADTWSTEMGSLAHLPPRSLLSGEPVPTGTSGAISATGIAAAAAGATLIGAIAIGAGWPASAFPAALIGGLGGSMFDSLLGATIQSRRWCDTCGVATERAVHACGTHTRHHGGLRWLDNDIVNLLGTVAGAFIGYVVARVVT